MKISKLVIVSLILASYSPLVRAQEANKKSNKNVIVKYKQYESFDLGSLEIKGTVIAPGDLSVQERSRKVFNRDLLERENFNPETHEDILNLR
jgi:hypothetical protein